MLEANNCTAKCPSALNAGVKQVWYESIGDNRAVSIEFHGIKKSIETAEVAQIRLSINSYVRCVDQDIIRIYCVIIEAMIRVDSQDRLNVVIVSIGDFISIVIHHSTHNEPYHPMSLTQMKFQPLKVALLLGYWKLRIVKFLMDETEVVQSTPYVSVQYLISLTWLSMSTSRFSILPKQILRYVHSMCKCDCLNAHGATKTPICDPL